MDAVRGSDFGGRDPLAPSGQVTAFAAAVTLAYALRVTIAMLRVMWGGRRLLHRPALLNRLGGVQQTFGVGLVLFAVGMVFGVDRRVQTALVDTLLALQQLTFLEETPAVQRQLEQKLPLKRGRPQHTQCWGLSPSAAYFWTR